MKKMILLVAVSFAMISCGTEEAAEPVKNLTICECLEIKGPLPAGCSFIKDLPEEEYMAEAEKCNE